MNIDELIRQAAAVRLSLVLEFRGGYYRGFLLESGRMKIWWRTCPHETVTPVLRELEGQLDQIAIQFPERRV